MFSQGRFSYTLDVMEFYIHSPTPGREEKIENRNYNGY